MQLGHVYFARCRRRLDLPRKGRRHPVNGSLLPGRYHRQMDAILCTDLAQSVLAFDRFQCYPRLELGAVTLAVDLAHIPSSKPADISLTTCPNFRDHLYRTALTLRAMPLASG